MKNVIAIASLFLMAGCGGNETSAPPAVTPGTPAADVPVDPVTSPGSPTEP